MCNTVLSTHYNHLQKLDRLGFQLKKTTGTTCTNTGKGRPGQTRHNRDRHRNWETGEQSLGNRAERDKYRMTSLSPGDYKRIHVYCKTMWILWFQRWYANETCSEGSVCVDF